MATELVTVVVGGMQYTAWELVKISASVKAAARSFELKIAAALGPGATASVFQPFTPLTIFSSAIDPVSGQASVGGDLMFSGYVDRYRGHLAKADAHIMISGRSKGQDAVDCSVEHRQSDYVDQTAQAIASAQDQFGIGFALDPSVRMEPIDRWRPDPGESLFRSLDPLCHDSACTMAGQPDGSILMTAAGVNPMAQTGALIEGWNILEIDGDIDVSSLHSHVHAHVQAAYGNGAQNTQISAVATNSAVPRHRPLHIHKRRHTSQARLLRHAAHRRDHEAGNGIKAKVKTQGWRDGGGALWTPGRQVFLQSPFAAIVQYMLIESADYHQDDKQGTIATLELVDPRAHGGQGGGVNKSGPAWGADSSPATPDTATPMTFGT